MRRKLPPVMRVMARAASPSAGSVLVGESGRAVELWVAGELPADQNQAEVASVGSPGVVPALWFQSVCLVDFTAWPRQFAELPCWSGVFTPGPTCRSQLLVRLYQA